MKSYHDFNGEREYYMRGDKVYRRGDPEPVKFNDGTKPPEPVPTGVGSVMHCPRCDKPHIQESDHCPTCGDWRETRKIFGDLPITLDPSIPQGHIKIDGKLHEVSVDFAASPSTSTKHLDRAARVGDRVEVIAGKGALVAAGGVGTLVKRAALDCRVRMETGIRAGEVSTYSFDNWSLRVLAPKRSAPSEDWTPKVGERVEVVLADMDGAHSVGKQGVVLEIVPHHTFPIHVEIDGVSTPFQTSVLRPAPSEDAAELKVGDWVAIRKVSSPNSGIVGIITEDYGATPESVTAYWLDACEKASVKATALERLTPDDGYEVESGRVVRGAFDYVADGQNAMYYNGKPLRRCVGDPRND